LVGRCDALVFGGDHAAFRVVAWTILSIPRIIHQTWKNHVIPAHFGPYVRSWLDREKNWRYVFWTDQSLLEFVSLREPSFLPTYQSLPPGIMRVDMARYLLLYHFGGLYADIDYERFRDLSPLLIGSSLVLGWEWSDVPVGCLGSFVARDAVSGLHREENTLGNAIMASEARHPLWLALVRSISANRPGVGVATPGEVFAITGPESLTRVFAKTAVYQWNYRLVDHQCLYPIGWHPPVLDDGMAASMFPRAYGAHHWAGTWSMVQPAGVGWVDIRSLV
jgi:mannosyltransferase OCH1-like enzyme